MKKMQRKSESAVNSGEALEMLDKLQFFFEENGAENEVLRSVASLTKKVEKMRIEFKTQKKSLIFLSNFFVRMNVNLNNSIEREKSTILKYLSLYFLSPKHKLSIFFFNQN